MTHSETVSKLIKEHYTERAQTYSDKDEAIQVYGEKRLENSLFSRADIWGLGGDEYGCIYVVTSILDFNDEQKELYLKDCADKGIKVGLPFSLLDDPR